ncbi:MAG: DUF5924 family protein [Myxococcales bacterium]
MSRWARLLAASERAMPWVSLGTSIVSAVWMDRSEAQGPWVAAAAAGSWLVFVVLSFAHRLPSTPQAKPYGRLHKLLRFGSTAASQSLLQLPLFFSAPFYFQASVFTPLQCAFGALFVVALAISAWDPWCSRALLKPVFGPALLAFASFVGFNAALPMLGVPHRTAAWITAGVVGFAIPAVHIAGGALGRQRLSALLVGLSVPLLLAVGGISAVPPAPLRVMSSGIGTQVVDRTLIDPHAHFARSPGALVCFSAVRAPHGLKDRLFHVWSLNGTEFYRLELKVEGGRRAGFRTWSRASLPRAAEGIVQCSVETGLGQTMARTQVSLGAQSL